jgi:hypothetical protein
MGNLLQNYKQRVVTRDDYNRLLHIFAISHRKGDRPYIAEALNPDTGSFEGHDSYNHSEHYFHSSFDDLVITGLCGLKPRADEMVEIDPLATGDWKWFAVDDVPYHGHRLSILWDRDGTRYKRGVGLTILVDGAVAASRPTLGKLTAEIAPVRHKSVSKTVRLNFAVNNDANYYPRLTSSFTNPKTPLARVNDGNYWYTLDPPNRWTTQESPNASDWLEVDFGIPRRIDTVRLAFLDDGERVVAPARYALEYFDGANWQAIPGQRRTPTRPEGHRMNTDRFAPRDVRRLRVVFTHAKGGFTGLSEIEAWGDGTLPYAPPPPQPGNVAYNPRGVIAK